MNIEQSSAASKCNHAHSSEVLNAPQLSEPSTDIELAPDLSNEQLPSFDRGRALKHEEEVICEATTCQQSRNSASHTFHRIHATAVTLASALSVSIAGMGMIVAKQIERAHCLDCWVTKVLPASLLLGVGSYLLCRLDKGHAERMRKRQQVKSEVQEEDKEHT